MLSRIPALALVLFSLPALAVPVRNTAEVYAPEQVLPARGNDTIVENPYTHEKGAARIGTVEATLNNVVQLNILLSSQAATEEQARILIEAIQHLLPSLRVAGMFDMFTPGEWLAAHHQPGRVMVGALYLQAYPQDINHKTEKQLKTARKHSTNPVLTMEIDKALAVATP